ncbi:MAG: family 10 glycosylhydrolase [Candidatus Saganbacteria bacterium]|nr:family 10 glycosylhydrolase [Candidatus Saganbacteria bacterium]
MWVTRFKMDSKEKIDNFVKAAAENGFNTLFVQVCGRGVAFYRSDILPSVDTGFDPLAYTVEKSHSRGISVHAWINTFLVWSTSEAPEQQDHIVVLHPEWILETRPMLFLNPAYKEVRDHLKDVCLEVAEKYDVDGLHLDYIRYPDSKSGFDNYSKRQYFNSFGVDPSYLVTNPQCLKDNYGPDGYRKIKDKWTDYRCANVTGLVAGLKEALKRSGRDISLSAAVYPDIVEAREDKGQDWLSWLNNGIVDFVVPMIYSDDPDKIKDMVLLDASLSKKKNSVVAGLAAFKMDADMTVRQIKMVRHYMMYYGSLYGVSLFSYDCVSLKPLYLEKLRKHAF